MIRTITSILLLVVLIVLVGWDVFVVVAHQADKATISEIVQDIGFRHPMIPFGTGVLVGHWFWPIDLGVKGSS